MGSVQVAGHIRILPPRNQVHQSTKGRKRACGCARVSHQGCLEVGGGRGRPGGGHDAVDGVLLLRVDRLHVERRAELRLALGLLSVQAAAVHATVAILCKECVDGLYSGLQAQNGGAAEGGGVREEGFEIND